MKKRPLIFLLLGITVILLPVMVVVLLWQNIGEPFQRQDRIIAELKKTVKVSTASRIKHEYGDTSLEKMIWTITASTPTNEIPIEYLKLTVKTDESVLTLNDDECRMLNRLPFLYAIEFHRVQLSPSGFSFLTENPKIKAVTFHDISIDKTSIQSIKRSSSICELKLNNVKFPERGLDEFLDKFPELYCLEIDGFAAYQFTKTDIDSITQCKNLDWLRLRKTSIEDDYLAKLVTIPKLEWLELSFSPITDKGMSFLRNSRIKCLVLHQTEISDVGLTMLQELPGLHLLAISGTKITDAGLDELSGLTKLTLLDITQTAITEEAVNRFKAANPHCQVRYGNDLPFLFE